MKIAVVGAGAMGSVYAGLFAEAGDEVHVIDPWQAHIDAIRNHGLRLSGASGDRVIADIHVHAGLQGVGICDLVVIATKAAGVAGAARTAAGLCGPRSLVLTIQNGLGAGERVRRHLPADNVLLGVAAGFGASVVAPGHVHHNGMALIRIGEMEGGLSDRVEVLAGAWRRAGFNVRAYADINQLIWEKFVCNVTFSAPCTVFDKTIGELMADPQGWAIGLGCAREAHAAGLAGKVFFEFDDVERYVTDFGSGMPDARPSMLLDHKAGRRSEIDAINGMVPVQAAKHGLTAPYNEVVSAIVRSREAGFTPPGDASA